MRSTKLAYACGQYHLVRVTYTHTPIIVSAEGIQTAAEGHECYMETIWKDEHFTRDDIDSADVQKGYLKQTVSMVVRRMFIAEQAQLITWKGHVRIQQAGSNPDPFFIGFASSFREACTWVATGNARLCVPWAGKEIRS